MQSTSCILQLLAAFTSNQSNQFLKLLQGFWVLIFHHSFCHQFLRSADKPVLMMGRHVTFILFQDQARSNKKLMIPEMFINILEIHLSD